MGEPKRYGLIIPNKKTSKPGKKLAVFDNDDSDNEESAHKEVNLSLVQEAEKKKQMKQTQIEIQKALKEDPTVYDYDAVYDEMEEKKKAANVKAPEKDRKPKYIEGLLKSAAARKREYERTVERQVQKERENEQGEFNDKEAFVTEAYRKKMQEQAEEEERLKRQEAIDAANDVTKQKDLSLFYRNLLNRNVSLGGSFTADDATKTNTDKQDDDNKDSKSKDAEEAQGACSDRKPENFKDDREHERNEEETHEDRRNTKSSPRHPTHHEHTGRKRRDSEGDEDVRRRSAHSPNKERRRPSERDREDTEHRRRSSPERHRSSHDDHRRSDRSRTSHEDYRHSGRSRTSHDDHRHSDRSRTSHDDRRERDRKRDHRGVRDHERKDTTKKNEDNSAEVVLESKDTKEKLNEETVSKFVKRSTGETVMSAKERYLARKHARDAAKGAARNDDSDED